MLFRFLLIKQALLYIGKNKYKQKATLYGSPFAYTYMFFANAFNNEAVSGLERSFANSSIFSV